MSTSSSRLGLYIPTLGDQANIVVTYGDWVDDIDAAVGSQVFTASTLPASGFSGKQVWDSTNNRLRVQASTSTGSTWRDVSVPVWTSLSGVTGTHTGELAFQTSDNTLNRWTGSTWTVYPAAATTAADRLYMAEFTTTTSVPNSTDFWPNFNSEIETSPHVTKTTEGGESIFTLNTTGLYTVTFQAVFATSTGGRRQAFVINGANSSVRYRGDSPSAAQNPFPFPGGTFERVFTAGATLQLQVNQDSGGALNMLPTATGMKTFISIRYVP